MLEQKLIVDRLIDLNLAPLPAPAYADGDFVVVPVQQCYLRESTGVFTKTSTVQPAPGPKAHRNFKWLPWLPGAIAECPLAGEDVLTGPMSGCWLVSYRKAGVPHAAHLGTDVASAARTAAVNGAWNALATARPADVIGGFNPLRHWAGPFPDKQSGEPAAPPKIFGLFTTSGEFYAMVAYQQASRATLLRIAGIQQITPSPTARLQHVDVAGP